MIARSVLKLPDNKSINKMSLISKLLNCNVLRNLFSELLKTVWPSK